MNTPLTVIPGWGLGRGPLEPLAASLNATIFDLPGFNGTPLIEKFTEAADALTATLPPGAALMGWSLGGMLSLAAAARHPENVGKLILIAGTASFRSREGCPYGMPDEQLAEFSAAALADFNALLPRFIGNFNCGDRHAKAIVRALLPQAEIDPPTATLANGLKWLHDVDLRPLLPQVTCPVLIIQGAEDPLMPLAAARQLANLLPNARLEVMEGIAHAPFLSEPECFLDLVRSFL